MTCATVERWNKIRLKTKVGKRRKRVSWVVWLFGKMFLDIKYVRATGVKISSKLVRDITWYILQNSQKKFPLQSVVSVDGMNLMHKIILS
jgi:hypothetical protein